MNRLCVSLVSLLLACPVVAFAQRASVPVAMPANPASASSIPAEARQFDFLLGLWQIEVRPKVSGLVALIHGTPRLAGTWKAWRAADSLGIEDNVRVADGSGNPITSDRSHRTWVKSEGRWRINGVDTAHGRSSTAIAAWRGGEMHVDGQFIDAEGVRTLTRTRYYDITANAFHWQQDRSEDNGKSWEEAALTIDARRLPASPTH